MSQSKVYAVFGAAGSYSDHREWPTRAFLLAEEAQTWMALLVADHERLYIEKQALEDATAENSWDRLSALKGRYDDRCEGYDIGDVSYRIIEIPLGPASALAPAQAPPPTKGEK